MHRGFTVLLTQVEIYSFGRHRVSTVRQALSLALGIQLRTKENMSCLLDLPVQSGLTAEAREKEGGFFFFLSLIINYF